MDTAPKLVLQNPYRILGVYANSPKRDIVANKGRATAFLTVNRPVEYPLDLKGILPAPNRTLDLMNEAEAHLAIAKEQIKYAQFWFLQKMSPLDDIAFNHLLAGNMAGAIEIWSKQESISSLQNRLVCYLIEGKHELAVKVAERLYEKFGNDYISKVDANCTLQMTAADLLHQFVDSLGEDIDMQKLLGFDLGAETKAYISSQTIGPLINKISAEVEKTKKVDHKDPKARIEAARKLVANTKEALSQLKSILPATDSQYQMIADKLGLEILQCGIDYFNNSEDDDAPHTAMKMQKYAQSVVVGNLAKQRCAENVKILQKIIDRLPPKEIIKEDRAIRKELEKYTKLPDKITYAITLLNNTKPHLQTIKNKMGVNNKAYLDLSTLVINNALHNVIEEVNAAQNRNSSDTLASCLREAWKAIVIMDSFDMDADTKKTRYIPNRNTLKDLCDNLLPPSGTESYLRSIDYAIQNFKGTISGRSYSSGGGNSRFPWLDTVTIDQELDFLGNRNSTKKIDAVMTLLRDTKQPLLSIKEKTSSSNDFYSKQSTRVASIALNTIIEVVNSAQSDPLLSYHLQMGQGGEFKALMRKCYDAMGLIDDMDVSSDFARHYRPNRETIRKICVNIGVINDFGGSGEGCAITLFTILATAAMSVYCIISIL
ncbi:MAG: hypothetical protein E7103_01710 [Prevotella sp.]|nr:hypothetical protein [Prevotella sp.]